MKDGDWLTADSLAARTGTAPRYTEEWLSQQAVRQLVEVQDARAEPRRYRLPAEHVPVLADPDTVLAAMAETTALARSARRLPDLVTAFRTGQAVPPMPWEPEGRAEPSRGLYLNLGPASRWRRPTHPSPWTASTSTLTRSRRPGATPAIAV